MKYKEEIKTLIKKGYSVMIRDPDGETFNEIYSICEISRSPKQKKVITNDRGVIIALQG